MFLSADPGASGSDPWITFAGVVITALIGLIGVWLSARSGGRKGVSDVASDVRALTVSMDTVLRVQGDHGRLITSGVEAGVETQRVVRELERRVDETEKTQALCVECPRRSPGIHLGGLVAGD